VLACSVDALDVIDVNVAVAVLVHLSEATHNDSLSCGVHGAADGTDKLIVFNEPAVVEIEGTEKSSDLTFAEAEHVVGDSLGEFVLVKGLRVVVVHDFELTAEANNATSATRSELLAELINEIVGAGLGSFGGSSSVDLAAEHFVGELAVLKSVVVVFVVAGVKSVKILLKKSKSVTTRLDILC